MQRGLIGSENILSVAPLQFSIWGFRVNYTAASPCDCFNSFVVEYAEDLVATTGSSAIVIDM